jgi:hypothetical protein
LKKDGNYGRKVSRIAKRYEPCGRKARFHNFLLYLPNLFTIQLIFLSYFPYLFTVQLGFLSYFPYLFIIQLAVKRYGKYGRKIS